MASAASGETGPTSGPAAVDLADQRQARAPPAAEVPVPPRHQHEHGAAGDDLAEAGEGVDAGGQHDGAVTSWPNAGVSSETSSDDVPLERASTGITTSVTPSASSTTSWSPSGNVASASSG